MKLLPMSRMLFASWQLGAKKAIDNQNSIVKLIAYDEISINGSKFALIVMRKYKESLKELVRRKQKSGIKPTKDDLEILFQFLVDSLKFIHDNGIIHRDLKPENILVYDDELILTDFGIAYYNPEYFSFKAETRKGERLANYLFSAPEQSEGISSPHPTMDIYALGQICQWYVTGRTHRGTGRARLTQYIEGVDLIDSIVNRCLANDLSQRFQSIDEIKEHIKLKIIQHVRKEPWDYIHKFHDVLVKTFPKL